MRTAIRWIAGLLPERFPGAFGGRPVGICQMTDEAAATTGSCGPAGDPRWDHIRTSATSRSSSWRRKHFFVHYKDLEPNKWVKAADFVERAKAEAEVLASLERFKTTGH